MSTLPARRSRNHLGRMAMVRRYYGVPARRGAEVIYRGLQFPVVGRIISSDGSHLYLRIENGGRFGPLHPTWEMDYGDGRDYGAEMDARIRARNEAWRTQQTGSINAPRL